MVRAPRSFKHLLAADPALAAWATRRKHEEALTAVVRSCLPRPLASRIRVADAHDGQLELAADAGAVAAIVRQRNGELLTALKHEGWQFTSIRVRVQVRAESDDKPKSLKNPIDRQSLQPLSALARRLQPGPLKEAIERLVRRSG